MAPESDLLPSSQLTEAPNGPERNLEEGGQVLAQYSDGMALLNDTVLPSAPGESGVGFFAESWQASNRFKDQPNTDLESLNATRQELLKLARLKKRIKEGSVKMDDVTLARSADGKTMFDYLDPETGKVTGSVSVGDVIIGLEEVAHESQNPKQKADAQKSVDFLKKHTDVTLGSEVVIYQEFEKRIIDEARKINPDYDNLTSAQQLALKEKARQQLKPKYQLVSAGAKAPEAGATNVESDKNAVLLFQALGIEVNNQEAVFLFNKWGQPGETLSEEELKALKSRRKKPANPEEGKALGEQQRKAAEALYKNVAGKEPAQKESTISIISEAVEELLKDMPAEEKDKLLNFAAITDPEQRRKWLEYAKKLNRPGLLELLLYTIMSVAESGVKAVDEAIK